ncbi:MAG: hypothetical protein AB7S50_06215 [Bacteroidales bacterium]
MIKKFLILTVLISNVFFTFVCGQDNAFLSGNLDFIKQEKSFNVVFNYESMAVGVFRTEEEYVQKKVIELNNSETGKGDEWLKKWSFKKSSDFPRCFLKSLNKKINKAEMKADTALVNAKYTFFIKPYYLEEGWDVVVNSAPAIVRMQILVCETANINLVVAEFRITGEYSSGSQLFGGMVAFDEAGKAFGKILMKSLK